MKLLSFVVSFLFLNLSLLADEVILKGKSLDPKITSVRIVDFPPIHNLTPPGSVTLAISEKAQNGDLILRFELDKEKILEFKILGETLRLLVCPGDSLDFEIANGGKVTFNGPRAAYYNYTSFITEQFPTRDFPRYEREKDLKKFQSSVNEWYERKINFLNQYGEDHQLSKEFVSAQKASISSEKQYLLLTPLIRHGFEMEDLPTEYLADIQTVKAAQLPTGEWYAAKHLLYQDVIAYREGKGKLLGDYSKENPSQNEVFALINLISYHTSSTKGQHYQQLKDAIAFASKHAEDQVWLAYLKKLDGDFNLVDNPFPDDLLKETVLTRLTDQKEISLAELLEQHKGSPIYIDFWASWCSPCIINIRESGEVKALLQERKVPIVFISVDKDATDWAKSAKKEGIEHSQYLLKGDFRSAFGQYLGIRSIPRYLILDRQHKVYDYDAPRPTVGSLKALEAIFVEIDSQAEVKKSEPRMITF